MQAPDIQHIIEELTSVLQTSVEDQASLASVSPSPIRSQDREFPEIGTQMATQIHSGQAALMNAKDEVPKAGFLALLEMLNKGSKDTANRKIQPQGSARSSPAKSILKPVSDQRAKGMSIKLEAKANKQQSQFQTQYQPPSSASVLDDQAIATKEREADRMPVSDDSEKENSQETSNSTRRKIPKNHFKTTQPQEIDSGTPPSTHGIDRDDFYGSAHTLNRADPMQKYTSAQHSDTNDYKTTVPFVDMFQDSNPFEGLKRIPRKFVRIPEEQKALLDRRDSWYEPTSTGRPVYAMIPPKVREQLDVFFDRQSKPGNSGHSDDGSDDLVDSESSDDSRDEDEEEKSSVSRREGSWEETLGRSSARTVDASTSSQQFQQSSSVDLDIGHTTTVRSTGIYEAGQADVENLDNDGEFSDNESSSRSVSWSPSLEGDVNEPEDPHEVTQHVPKEQSSSHTQSTDELPDQSGQTSSSATGRLPSPYYNRSPELYLARRPPIPTFPSSSPGEDDELPLDVPLAVDGVFAQDEGEMTSQELPCTAPQDPKHIQVEQTPFPVPRTDGSLVSRSGDVERRIKSIHSSQDILSSQVIPATFDTSRPLHHISDSGNDRMQSQIRTFGGQELASLPSKLEGRLGAGEVTDTTTMAHTSSRALDEQAISSAPINQQKSPIVRIPATSRRSKQSSAIPSSSPGSGRRGFRIDETSSKEKSPTLNIKQRPRSSTAESNESVPIDIDRVFRTARHSYVEDHVRSKRLQQDAILDFNESRLSASATLIDQTRISSTYVEGSQDHIRPTKVPPRPAGTFEEGATAVQDPIARVGPDPISSSLDNLDVVLEESEELPFASHKVVDLRSPSPDNSRMTQEEAATIRDPASQTISDHDSPNLKVHATKAVEDGVEEEQHHASDQVSSLDDSAEGNDVVVPEEAAPSQRAVSRGGSKPEDSALDRDGDSTDSPALGMSTQPMFYDEFKATYPEYEGSEGAFIRALVYLEWLLKERQTGPAHFDDFVRFMVSYERHVRDNQHSKEKVPPGFVVYNQTITKPEYRYNVISSRNLEAALRTLNSQIVEFVRSKYWTAEGPIKESSTKTSAGATPVGVEEGDMGLDDQGTLLSDEPHSTQGSSDQGGPSISRVQSPMRGRFQALKKPFFETASQLVNVVQQKETVETPNRASSFSSNGSGSKPRSQKPLPWLRDKKPDNLSNSVTSRARDSASRSSSAGRGLKVDWAEVRRERKRREREEAARALKSLGSPILGSLRDIVSPEASPSPHQTKRKRISQSFTFGEQDDPFTENPKPSKAARRTTMPASRSMDDLRGVSHEKKRKRTSEGSFSYESSFTESSKPSKAARRVTLPAAKSKDVNAWIRKTPTKMTFEQILEERKFSGKPRKSASIQKLTDLSFGTVKDLKE